MLVRYKNGSISSRPNRHSNLDKSTRDGVTQAGVPNEPGAYFLPPSTVGALARITPTFELGLLFDLVYTTVKFLDCILHGCDSLRFW